MAMAVNFVQTQKRQRYLILILALIICAILVVVWQGFSRRETSVAPVSPPVTPLKIKINLELLKDARLEKLEVFEPIPVLEKQSGRKNPFTPY